MNRISRPRRAEMQRIANAARQRGQRSGWPVGRIVDQIRREVPEMTPLEAWRLGYGWSRHQVLDGIAELYFAQGLAPPAMTTSMLCRWEHDATTAISVEYIDVLVRLYRASLTQPGIEDRAPAFTVSLGPVATVDPVTRTPRP